METNDYLRAYDSLLMHIKQGMVELVGVHTVSVLVQRAVWATRQKYAEAVLIQYNEEGINFQGLQDMEPEEVRLLVEEFIRTLLDILTRLVGREVSSRLIKEVEYMLANGGKKTLVLLWKDSIKSRRQLGSVVCSLWGAIPLYVIATN